MRAYTIFLMLLLFGLVSAAVEELAINPDQNMKWDAFNENSEIQDITDEMMTGVEQTEDSFWLTYFPKVAFQSAVLLGKALLYSVTLIPLLSKMGAPIILMSIIQTMQTVTMTIAIASWWRGASTKHID